MRTSGTPVRTPDDPSNDTAGAKPRRRGRGRRRRARRRWLTWRRALVALAALGVLVCGAFAVLYVVIDIPRPNELARAESNVYLYSDGSRLARTGEINRESVPLESVPEKVQLTFVAAENKDFYSDSGISLSGTVRGIGNTIAGRGAQGGSTITQQYVKNYYLSQEQTLSRKVKELFISLKVDRHLSKSDILAGYLNSSYYGRRAYGIQAAARAYYGVEVGQLTVEQGAYLAALLQAPSQYDWATAGPTGRKLVHDRWNYVLDNMVGQDWLDRGARERMTFPVPREPRQEAGLGGQTGYLVEAAKRELMRSGVSEQELAGGGWRVTLTVDPRRQRALETAITSAGTSVDGGPARHLRPVPSGRTTLDKNVQAGAVSLDPRNGRIVAMYGGRDSLRQYLSNTQRADYQAGPTFGPVLRAAAAAQDEGDSRSPGLDPAVTVETADALGMKLDESEVKDPKALKLGLVGVSPMELTRVYASLRNDGRKVTPSIVKSATRDDEGTGVRDPIGTRMISASAARAAEEYLATESRSARVKRTDIWTENGIESVQQVAGRSDDGKAEWAVAATEELLTTVGLFGENAKTRRQVPLKSDQKGLAAEIWNVYTQAVAMPGPPPGPSPSKGP
ncbi:transglycosylase domain-containing protein [Streptomyces sp. NPDC057638]|uniref:transglycosylase domain-containing protein n=1 Tax=Streptomyces sp. NPDC057638 TaxID=3346190 RepID=UPI00369CB11A